MNRYALALIALFIAHGAYAQESQPRLRDLSLPPDESFKQPDISHSPGDNDPNYQQPTNDVIQQRMRDSALDNNPDSQPSSFMASYCNTNFRPAVANDAKYTGMASCLETQKKQACEAFHNLPVDVQITLDQAIACDSDDTNREGFITQKSECFSYDSRRLQLLKKYWRNQNAASALVFLPDDVLNASEKCIQGGR